MKKINKIKATNLKRANQKKKEEGEDDANKIGMVHNRFHFSFSCNVSIHIQRSMGSSTLSFFPSIFLYLYYYYCFCEKFFNV